MSQKPCSKLAALTAHTPCLRAHGDKPDCTVTAMTEAPASGIHCTKGRRKSVYGNTESSLFQLCSDIRSLRPSYDAFDTLELLKESPAHQDQVSSESASALERAG